MLKYVCLRFLPFGGFDCSIYNQDARNELRRRQVLEHERNMYFPSWRSALRRKSMVKIIPSYASFKRLPSFPQLDTASGSQKVLKKGYSTLVLGLMGRRVPQLSSGHQQRHKE